MALQPSNQSSHNRMLGQRIVNLESTNFFEPDGDPSMRPAKRQRRGTADQSPTSLEASKRARDQVPDSDADPDDEDDALRPSQTDLESTLPPIRTDQEAIDEYETLRAAEQADRGVIEGRLNDRSWTRGKSSIYVDAFNLALQTVLDEESHLFDEAEKALFGQWRGLSYEAQYLYVRLFLRKTSAWHRINTLGYHSDVADIEKTIEELQQIRTLPYSSANAEQRNPGELRPPAGTMLGELFTFADRSEEHITSLEEASSLLRLDELKLLAKDAKVQGKNKKELLSNFRRASGQQRGLAAVGLRRSDTEASEKSANRSDSGSNTPYKSEANGDDVTGTDINCDAYFLNKILDETGACIRLTLAPLKLFERVHLVFYRSTEWTEKSLTTIILARISRRNFPEYVVSRSANVFESRALLVEYEAALRTQYEIDNILEFNGKPTAEAFQRILDIFEEVYPRWKALLDAEHRKETETYHSGEGAYLRRLSPAWVYTRIIHKAAFVFGKLKQHKREHELLCELLEQRLFHHARRGDWYQRKALLEEHYMGALTPKDGRSEDIQKKHWKRIALETCEDGLQDPLVHLTHHYDLQKRVTKLEKALNIPKRLQHDFSHVRLAAPVEVTIEGVRIERSGATTSNRRSSSPHPTKPGPVRGAKTIWLDPLEGDGECSVEAMCLSHYRKQGWKGYYSEGGIVRTLFAYLLCDVLFAYVPNVFQTPFQTCPLDLHTDAFFAARLSEINARLNDISNGAAPDIIQGVWTAHHERRTCIVGLDWSFELADLLDIARLFDPDALATVCKVMAQEYAQRGGGVPDLFLWHEGLGRVMFVEVKSENDRLSDTQRLWTHVLTGAGVRVELANARAKEVRVLD